MVDEARYRQAERALWASVGQEPTEREVTLPDGGSRIRIQEVGEGEPLLLLHGAPNAGATFAPLVPHLGGRRLLLLDRPGCGLSGPAAPLDAAALPAFGARFLPQVLDALDLERVDVVASSFGGYLALRAAAAAPQRLRTLVQLGCPAFVPGMRTPTMIRAIASPLRHVILRLPPSERAATGTMRQLGHTASIRADRLPTALVTWFTALQAHTDTFRSDGALISRLVHPRRGPDPSLTLDAATLAAATVPTLLVWGADDAFGGAETGERLRAALPDAQLVVRPESGHLPWLDDPAGTAALVEAHVAGHAAAA